MARDWLQSQKLLTYLLSAQSPGTVGHSPRAAIGKSSSPRDRSPATRSLRQRSGTQRDGLRSPSQRRPLAFS